MTGWSSRAWSPARLFVSGFFDEILPPLIARSATAAGLVGVARAFACFDGLLGIHPHYTVRGAGETAGGNLTLIAQQLNVRPARVFMALHRRIG
jgi:hypothetical protein